MKKVLTVGVILSIASARCWGQTNRTQASTATNSVAIPADVVHADAKVIQLYDKRDVLESQMSQIQRKQMERFKAHLNPLPTDQMQLNSLLYQKNLLRQQIVQAERYDYQIRDFHHLPPFRMPKAIPVKPK